MVYFIEAENGYVKIGASTDPTGRLKALQAASPLRLRLAAIIRCTEAQSEGYEKALHHHYRADRLHGEWFKPSEKLRRLMRRNSAISLRGVCPFCGCELGVSTNPLVTYGRNPDDKTVRSAARNGHLEVYVEAEE